MTAGLAVGWQRRLIVVDIVVIVVVFFGRVGARTDRQRRWPTARCPDDGRC